jgi:LuxR family transcriptional regulator, maltose regulon positive regulatory protein
MARHSLDTGGGLSRRVFRSPVKRHAGLGDRAAWVPVPRGEGDPQRFWLAVLAALRRTAPGSALVRELTAAPDLDGWAIVERLLKDLAPLADPAVAGGR